MPAPEFRPETLPQSVRSATEMQGETLKEQLIVPDLLKSRLGIDQKITAEGLAPEFRGLIPYGKEALRVAVSIDKKGQTFNQELCHALYGDTVDFAELSDEQKYLVLTIETILDQHRLNISKVEPGDSFIVDFNEGKFYVVSRDGVPRSAPVELSVDLFHEQKEAITQKSFDERQKMVSEMQGNTLGKVFQQLFNKLGTPTERLQLLKDVPALVDSINADLRASGHGNEALNPKNLDGTYNKTAVQNEAYKRALIQMMEASYKNEAALHTSVEALDQATTPEVGQDAYALISYWDALYKTFEPSDPRRDEYLEKALALISKINDLSTLEEIINRSLSSGTGLVNRDNRFGVWSPELAVALEARWLALGGTPFSDAQAQTSAPAAAPQEGAETAGDYGFSELLIQIKDQLPRTFQANGIVLEGEWNPKTLRGKIVAENPKGEKIVFHVHLVKGSKNFSEPFTISFNRPRLGFASPREKAFPTAISRSSDVASDAPRTAAYDFVKKTVSGGDAVPTEGYSASALIGGEIMRELMPKVKTSSEALPAERPTPSPSERPPSRYELDIKRATQYARLSQIDGLLKSASPEELRSSLAEAKQMVAGLSKEELQSILNRSLIGGAKSVSDPYEAFDPRIAQILRERDEQLGGSTGTAIASNAQ